MNKKKKWREDERKMDEISFKEWLTENEKEQGVGKSGSLMVGGMFTSLTTCEPEEYSLLFFLKFLRSCDGYHPLVDVKDGSFPFFFFQNLSLKFSFPKSKNRNSRGKCFLLVSLI